MRGLGLGRFGERWGGSLRAPPSASALASGRGHIPFFAYGALSALALALGFVRGESPFITAPILPFEAGVLVASSLTLGVMVAGLTIYGTRSLVRTFSWAKLLHESLRPAVKDASTTRLLAIAVASGFGEELFFRGLLVPTIGVIGSSLLFGAIHQTPGKARFIWATWAALMGLVFALIFRLTGSLAGPIAAHIAINAANLVFLRDTAPRAKPRKLGGLLGA